MRINRRAPARFRRGRELDTLHRAGREQRNRLTQRETQAGLERLAQAHPGLGIPLPQTVQEGPVSVPLGNSARAVSRLGAVRTAPQLEPARAPGRSAAVTAKDPIAPLRGNAVVEPPTTAGERKKGEAGSVAGRRRIRFRRARTALVWTACSLAIALVGVTMGSYFFYRQLQGNISARELGPGRSGEHLELTPMNILLINSNRTGGRGDTGDTGSTGDTYTRADRMMLIHLFEGRRAATALSFPVNLITDIPACANGDGSTAQGSASAPLASSIGDGGRGPECATRTVQRLTGLPISHSLIVSERGLADLSTALGGVEVCKDLNAKSPRSRLELPPGRHLIAGKQVPAFLETPEKSSDDLERIQLQQQLAAAMIRKVKEDGYLNNPVRRYELSKSAAQSFPGSTNRTIFRGLGILSRMETKDITFVTVPVRTTRKQEGQERTTLDTSTARHLFATIAAGNALTPKDQRPPAPSATAGSAPLRTGGLEDIRPLAASEMNPGADVQLTVGEDYQPGIPLVAPIDAPPGLQQHRADDADFCAR